MKDLNLQKFQFCRSPLGRYRTTEDVAAQIAKSNKKEKSYQYNKSVNILLKE